MQEVVIIGVDCSTNLRKLGLARGLHRDGRTAVCESRVGESDPVGLISSWLGRGKPSLIAIDAPLKLRGQSPFVMFGWRHVGGRMGCWWSHG
jgi:predicted RNase H-like nuclease